MAAVRYRISLAIDTDDEHALWQDAEEAAEYAANEVAERWPEWRVDVDQLERLGT